MSRIDQCQSVSNTGNTERIYSRMKSPGIAQRLRSSCSGAITLNLAVVMRTMGPRNVKTAMHCQRPELEVVRAALDYGTPNDVAEARAERKGGHDTFESHP
jgi:hypothetical protein